MISLSSLRTYNDEQMISLLKVIGNYISLSGENCPEEIQKLLMKESSRNVSKQIRVSALEILRQLKTNLKDIDPKILEYIDFEDKLSMLQDLTDANEINRILKELSKTDFSQS